jgi:phosphate-selective porin OprO/OprP
MFLGASSLYDLSPLTSMGLCFIGSWAATLRRVAPIAVVTLVSIAPAAAQSSDDSAPKPSPSAQSARAAEGGWAFSWDEHPSLRLGKAVRLDFRARLQGHLRESAGPLGDPSAFDVARRRVGVAGRIGRVVDFQVENELGDSDAWRDVYVSYRQFEAIEIQSGKFKLPFSLDEHTSSSNLDFVYRSRAATQLAPGRDLGVMAEGRLLKRALRYELGVFDHDGRNARTRDREKTSGDTTIAGRLTVQPFRMAKNAASDLQVAVAFTGSEVPEGIAALRGRTAFNASFFDGDLWVRGQRRRVGVELRWRPGPFSVKAEHIRVTTERLGQDVDGADLPELVATGWYVSGTWVLSGQSKAGAPDSPPKPLFRGGFGAVELAARIESLAFRSNATEGEPSTSPRAYFVAPNSDRLGTLGLNWYVIRGFKIQGNVIHEKIADPDQSPVSSRSRFWSAVLLFQLAI